jgi:uncharacterized protein (TIRG00374 family)
MQPSRRQLIRGAAIGLGLALAVFVGLAIAGDLRELRSSLARFRWEYLAPVLGLTIWNYWWRFRKWEIYLEALGVPHIPRATGVPIFLSGFAMSVTPGKVGEIIKAYYVRRETDAPIERVSGAVVAERATDAFAMLVLALIGATQFDYGRWFVGAIVLAGGAALFALRQPAFVRVTTGVIARIPVMGRFAHLVESMIDAIRHLLSPRLLALGTGIGVISWLGECIAFFAVLVGLGLDASWSLLMVAIFVLAVSSLAGGISMLPGGLGVADASVAGMLLVLIDDPEMTDSLAVAATLIIRFATLWFAVLIGALMLLVLRRRSRVARLENS